MVFCETFRKIHTEMAAVRDVEGPSWPKNSALAIASYQTLVTLSVTCGEERQTGRVISGSLRYTTERCMRRCSIDVDL